MVVIEVYRTYTLENITSWSISEVILENLSRKETQQNQLKK